MCTDITTTKGKLTITVMDKDKGKDGIFTSTCVQILQHRKGTLTITVIDKDIGKEMKKMRRVDG